MTEIEGELLFFPCPFCGKQPKKDMSIKNSEPVYSCCVTEYMSKEAWNKRHQPEQAKG